MSRIRRMGINKINRFSETRFHEIMLHRFHPTGTFGIQNERQRVISVFHRVTTRICISASVVCGSV